MTSVIVPGLVALALLPSAAPARTAHVRVGVADQRVGMFDAKAYRALHLRITRYFIPWDAARHRAQLARADAYVARARARRVKVLMHISSNDLRPKRARLPSVAGYRRYVGALVRRYRPRGVTEWGTFNEANNKTEPTYRSPSRAAAYFLTLRHLCRGCTIVALDIQDQPGAERYIQRFYAALRGWSRFAHVVGLHNYSDVNRPYRHGSGTRSILRTVRRFNRRTQFWMTETGGIVNFSHSFRCDPRRPAAAERRAARAEAGMFAIARAQRAAIKRLYVYNWSGAGCRGFDTGLTRRNGSLRPAYATLRRALRSFVR